MSYESEKREAAEAKANEEKKYLTKEEIEKKTFKPKEDDELFRILPDSNNETNIEKAHFHEVMVNGFSQTVYCPKHNDGKECALCDEYERIKATQVENPNFNDKEDPITISNAVIYKEAVKYKPILFRIAKGIDKGSPKDGVKFWRFKENKKKEGIFDKIEPLIENFVKNGSKPICDVELGADLQIKTVVDTIPSNGKKYKKVNNISLSNPTPLYHDAKKIEEWVNDKMTWREIFRPNTLPGLSGQQYLQAIIDDKVPVWNKETKKWEEKKAPVDESAKVKKEIKNKSLVTNTVDVTPVSDETDDLPF